MSLYKEHKSAIGIQINYWKIVEVRNYILRGAGHIIVGGYVGQEQREQDAAPVEFIEFTTPLLDDAGMLESAYKQLKLNEFFYGALDA